MPDTPEYGGNPEGLTERELLIAKAAARMAVEQMTNEIYVNIGKTVVKRFFFAVGILVAGIAVGKGWVNPMAIFGGSK